MVVMNGAVGGKGWWYLILVVTISVRSFRERANSREAEAEVSRPDTPPECDSHVADSDEWW